MFMYDMRKKKNSVIIAKYILSHHQTYISYRAQMGLLNELLMCVPGTITISGKFDLKKIFFLFSLEIEFN